MDTKTLYCHAQTLANCLRVYIEREAANQHKTPEELEELGLSLLGWGSLKNWDELTEKYR